ncbi:MAG: hypothetical protein IH851_03065 [Armatimonadetes bacterium]|nr:hypothetical protein [Armatimonadota bacterium]
MWLEARSSDPKHPGHLVLQLGGKGAYIELKGERTELGIGTKIEEFVDLLYDEKKNIAWVVTYLGNSTLRGSYIVYRIDWARRRALRVCSGYDVGFWPARTHYATVSTRRLVRYEDEKYVWQSMAEVGDWATGERRQILSGLVDVTSISLRP